MVFSLQIYWNFSSCYVRRPSDLLDLTAVKIWDEEHKYEHLFRYHISVCVFFAVMSRARCSKTPLMLTTDCAEPKQRPFLATWVPLERFVCSISIGHTSNSSCNQTPLPRSRCTEDTAWRGSRLSQGLCYAPLATVPCRLHLCCQISYHNSDSYDAPTFRRT